MADLGYDGSAVSKGCRENGCALASAYVMLGKRRIEQSRFHEAGFAFRNAGRNFRRAGMQLAELLHNYLAESYADGKPDMESPLQKALLNEYIANYSERTGDHLQAFRHYVDAGDAFMVAGREDDANNMFAYAEHLMDRRS